MKNIILIVFGSLFFSSLEAWASETDRIARIGLIADIQYCDCPDSNNGRLYRSSLERLKNAIPTINDAGVDFTVDLGDIVDRDVEGNLDTVLFHLQELKAPRYSIMGNHDVKGVYRDGYKSLQGDLALNRYMEDLGIPSNYYFVEKDGCMYIFLDTNEVSKYSIDPSDSEKSEEYKWWYESAMLSFQNNVKDYNGAISKKQLEWLENLLIRAERETKKVILFGHHPLSPENGYQALNNRNILDLLSKYTCVEAVFCGHHHSGNIITYKNRLPIVTLKGLVEYNAFAIVDVYPDRIVLKGYGKMESKTFYNGNSSISPERLDTQESDLHSFVTKGTITLKNAIGKSVYLFNAQGVVVRTIVCKEKIESIDLSSLEKGIYFLNMGSRTAKMVLY